MHPILSNDARATRRPSFVLSALLSLGLSASVIAQTAPYDKVDNVGGSFVNLATFPVRPMVFDTAQNLWVVNHHDSTIERFTGTATAPNKIYGVPWQPVAIGWWNGNGGSMPAELLVVCRGTWALVGIDPNTGVTTRVVQLRPGDPALPGALDTRIGRMAEPGDLLIDQTNHRAFISCTGSDSVVQIDLQLNQVVRVFDEEIDPAFRIKSPLFLSFDHNGVDVLCAPLHSGNNSFAVGNLQQSTLVRDFAGLTFPEQGLPDEDLFRITPLSTSNPGSAQPIVTGMGTILFAHGLHPLTSDFWQLNTEANNKDPNKQTEPKVKGQIVKNQVTIVQNSGSTWGTSPQPPIVLEPGGLSGITMANTVGQPFALSFGPSGYVFIAGLLTDNILVLDQNGAFAMEFDLPAGAIPRGIVHYPSNPQFTLVYCWGLNQVRAYIVNPAAGTVSPRATYQLNYDPTPPEIAAGRTVFFDGDHSQERNDSCASCHIEGGSDFLVWNLSNGPMEEKGPMFTQTLVGLSRLAPFHWRGERQLINFQPAFVGLLGAAPATSGNLPGEEPSAADFAAFEKYVFSLNNPANPNQNRLRVIDANIHAPDTTFDAPTDPTPPGHDSSLVGNAITGQTSFKSDAFVNVARHSCVDCHAFPTGTNNDINVEAESSPIVRRASMKPAPFHEIWRKQMSLVEVMVNEGPVGSPTSLVSYVAAFLGSGFSHLGTSQDLFRFVSTVTDVDTSVITDDKVANDLTDLLIQWDQGLAPAVHFAYLMTPTNALSTTTTDELDTYLHGEQTKQNCDIAVIGTAKHPTTGVLQLRRWAWSRRGGIYLCEDPVYPNRTLAQFKTGASVDLETNQFIGLPVGMAERFAIDYDMDGVPNLDATELASKYNPAAPGFDNGVPPGFVPAGGPTFLWNSTKVARIVFETNEPTTAVITYSEPKTLPPPAVQVTRLTRNHSVLLPAMRPSTSSIDAIDAGSYAAETVTYAVTIKLIDATGNPATFGPFNVTTDDFIVPKALEAVPTPTPDGTEKKNMRTHVVRDLCMKVSGGNCDELVLVGGKWRTRVNVDVAFKRGSWVMGTSVYEPVPAPGRVVVGRVLIQHSNGVIETASALNLTVTPLSNAALVDTPNIDLHGAGDLIPIGGVPAPAGKFLAGLAVTDSAGETSIEFEVDPASGSGMVTGDKVVFNVEGILELRPGLPFPPITLPTGRVIINYPTEYRGAWNQWSFPDTMEELSSVTSIPIP